MAQRYIKAVQADGWTRLGYVWDLAVGAVNEAPSPEKPLYVASSFGGASTGGRGLKTVLVVEVDDDDVAPWPLYGTQPDDKVAVLRAKTVAIVDGHAWLGGRRPDVDLPVDRSNLAGADLDGAYLVGADLDGANLARASLDGANLARANLDGAYLAGAYLAGANLAGANLAGAYLARAYLARANLAGANLDGATYDEWTRFPSGFVVPDSMVRVGP